MTTFTQPLQAPQYAKLRASRYAGDRVLTLFKNRVVLSGTVDTDLSALTTWATFAYTTVTGDYTDCFDNQVLLIGTIDDIKKATFRGRLRGAPTASDITCNESSLDFNGAFFWVIDTYDIQYVQSRTSSLKPSEAIELVNYDQEYQGLLPRVLGLKMGYAADVDAETGYLRLGFDISRSKAAEFGETVASYLYYFPNAIVRAGALDEPIVIVDIPYGEQWGHATVTDTADLSLTRKFGIKAIDDDLYPPDTGFEGYPVSATLDQGYTMSIPAFADVDDVLYNTFAIAYRRNEQIDGVRNTLYKPSSADVTNKELTSNVATLTSAGHTFEVGQTIIVADTGVGFDGTWVISAVTSTTYSFPSVHANVASTGASGMAVANPDNVDFVGWFMRENDAMRGDPTYSVSSNAKFVFTGVGPRLSRLTAQFVVPRNNFDPTEWGDIFNANPWKAKWHFWSRYTTMPVLCDVDFEPDDDTYLFPEFSTQGGNSLRSLQEIAAQWDGSIAFAPTGEITVNRDVNFLSQDERDLIDSVATFTVDDAIDAIRDIDPNPNVGKADADTAYYDPATSQVTYFATRSPGNAQGEAEGTESLPAQILAAGSDATAALLEAKLRIGSKFNMANLREYLDIVHPDGYVGIPIVPSRSQIYHWILQDVGGPNGVNRVDYDGTELWTVESVNYEYNPKRGTFQNRVRYRRVAEPATPGDDITQQLPPPGAFPPLPFLGFPSFNFQNPLVPQAGVPNLPAAAKLPPKNYLAKPDGNTVLAWGGSTLALIQNFINMPTPQTRNITPSLIGTRTINCACFDPRNSGIARANNYAYEMDTNNTNSLVRFTANCFAPVPAYLQSDPIDGVYTLLRTTPTAGTLLAYGSGTEADSWAHTFDFTDDDFGWTGFPGSTSTPDGGVYSAGVGFISTLGSVGTRPYRSSGLHINIPSTNITSMTATYTITAIGSLDAGTITDPGIYFLQPDQVTILGTWIQWDDIVTGANQTFSCTGLPATLDQINLIVGMGNGGPGDPDPGGSGKITSIAINGTGANPFAEWTHEFDFTDGSGGFVTRFGQGTYTSSVGWEDNCVGPLDPPDTYYRGASIDVFFAERTITEATFTFSQTVGGDPTVPNIKSYDGASWSGNLVTIPAVSGSGQTITLTGLNVTQGIEFNSNVDTDGAGCGGTTGTLVITHATIKGSGSDPFVFTGEAVVLALTNNGITPGTPVTVGDSPGPKGAFDVQKGGTRSYAAAAAKLRKASTLGGAYSDFIATTGANPVCCVIPLYEFGYTDLAHKNTTTATPCVMVALDAADSDGGSLYRVSGAGTKTDITPTAGMTFDSDGCIAMLYGTHAAVVGLVGGNYKQYVSTDIGSGDTWTLVESPDSFAMIRPRRNDVSSKVGGDHGQLFIAENGTVGYSATFSASGNSDRTLPFTVSGIDILN